MTTHLQKRIADIKAAKLDKRRERQYIAQLKRQGWSNMDLWGLNTHLARYILPMLRKFFKNPMGHPCNLKSVKEWQAIGAKMIWALERHALDDMFELAEKTTGYRPSKAKFVDTTNGHKAMLSSGDEVLRTAWIKELDRLHRQEQEGMRLFGEYFGNLWD